MICPDSWAKYAQLNKIIDIIENISNVIYLSQDWDKWYNWSSIFHWMFIDIQQSVCSAYKTYPDFMAANLGPMKINKQCKEAQCV